MAESGDSEIRRRFERYVAAFRGGQADPDPVLAGLDESAKRKLGRMIDEFLEAGPVPDPELMSPGDPRVQAVVADLMPRLDGRAGALSRLLARRRQQLGLSQAGVIDALAEDLEASESEKGKIDAYYHDLEWGTLPAAGLTERILDALSRTLKTTTGSLREAGRTLGPARASSTGPIYARMVEEDGDAYDLAVTPAPAKASRQASPPDRIDRLFTGG